MGRRIDTVKHIPGGARLGSAGFILFALIVSTALSLVACSDTAILGDVKQRIAEKAAASEPTVAKPQFNPTEGTYSSDQQVSITDSTDSATIYYTFGAEPPTTSSLKYTGPVSVAGNGTQKTITAIAVADGMKDSAPNSATFTINYDQVSTPQFSPNAGQVFDSPQSITITDSTNNVEIYYTYTTNGTEPRMPTPSDNDGSGATGMTVTVSGTGTVWKILAIAVEPNGLLLDSTVAESPSYTVNYPPASPPAITPGSGTHTVTNPASFDVTIDNLTANGTSVAYTTDGSNPTPTHYTATSSLTSFTVTISSSSTLKAIVFGGNYSPSTVSQESYVLQAAGP